MYLTTSTQMYVTVRSARHPAPTVHYKQCADNQNVSFLPAITSTSTRMHGEFLRHLFLQAHRETEAHFNATGIPSQRNQSDSFRSPSPPRSLFRDRPKASYLVPTSFLAMAVAALPVRSRLPRRSAAPFHAKGAMADRNQCCSCSRRAFP
jgi:hypothetical protein